jgi:hypothetical protein
VAPFNLQLRNAGLDRLSLSQALQNIFYLSFSARVFRLLKKRWRQATSIATRTRSQPCFAAGTQAGAGRNREGSLAADLNFTILLTADF